METTAKSKTILIIDDEKDLRDAMSMALGYEGFATILAADGKEGLTRALVEKPDLIFLDILMPVMDGIEMLKLLRKDPWGKTVPVIVMTAIDSMDKIAEVIEQGGNEYLPKSRTTLGTIVQKAKGRLGA